MQGISPRSDVWLTPSFIVESLGGWESFDLDPCTPKVQPWPTARKVYTEKDDGLIQPWVGRVFLNPPYSKLLLMQFMKKMVSHNHGTALIFAKTETRIFFECVWSEATALFFIRHRLHFCDRDGSLAPYNGGCGSVLVGYGKEDAEILSELGLEGKFVPLKFDRSWCMQQISNLTWRQALADFFSEREGPVELSEIYKAFETNPKVRSNPNYQAKVRQMLKRPSYVNVGRGVWQKAV